MSVSTTNIRGQVSQNEPINPEDQDTNNVDPSIAATATIAAVVLASGNTPLTGSVSNGEVKKPKTMLDIYFANNEIPNEQTVTVAIEVIQNKLGKNIFLSEEEKKRVLSMASISGNKYAPYIFQFLLNTASGTSLENDLAINKASLLEIINKMEALGGKDYPVEMSHDFARVLARSEEQWGNDFMYIRCKKEYPNATKEEIEKKYKEREEYMRSVVRKKSGFEMTNNNASASSSNTTQAGQSVTGSVNRRHAMMMQQNESSD